LLRLALRVRVEDAEIVLSELLELAPAGVEQVDGEGWVEYAIYGAPGEVPELPDLRATAGDALVDVTTTEVDDDWADRWREFHRPLVVDGRLRVRPPWEPSGGEQFDIVIDPGRAFGTGAHPTTSLCLELLLDSERVDGSLLDLGCGSGVLAILAGRLGFDPVTAVDNDPLAVEASVANCDVNGVAVACSRLDLRSEPVPPSDVLVANILAPILVELAVRVERFGGREAILSGILDEQAEDVAAAWNRIGLAVADSRSRSGWTALRMVAA